MESDISANSLSVVLCDIAVPHVNTRGATRAIDEASWQFMFKRNVRKYKSLPPRSPSEVLGQRVLKKFETFAVRTVAGDLSAGKYRDVPPSLLGTLMQRYRRRHTIALILELEEAQNALYEHMQQEHPQIAPWVSLWNGDPKGHA